ncbi:MAG: transketolase [Acutalibacteraceae bacterium]
MDNCKRRELEIFAAKVRMGVIEGTYNAKAGHPGGSLSIADVLAYLYNCEMKVDPKNPDDPARDRLVLSKGHCAPALYAALALKGYFSTEEIKHLRHLGAMLQGHPDMKGIPGVDMSSGSLGQGISAACGMALSAKLSSDDWRVYTILGDGEIEEGQVWEAAMFAANKKLDNLVAYVDFNNLQIDGTLEQVNSPFPIDEKFRAFGWETISIDGHDFDQIADAFAKAREIKGRPTCIIASSVKGKGVSFMENQVGWHGKAPNAEEYAVAMTELDAALAQLEQN